MREEIIGDGHALGPQVLDGLVEIDGSVSSRASQ